MIFISICVCFRQKAAEQKRAEDARLAREAAEEKARYVALCVPLSLSLSLSPCVCVCLCDVTF